jgi:hypothetical protein
MAELINPSKARVSVRVETPEGHIVECTATIDAEWNNYRTAADRRKVRDYTIARVTRMTMTKLLEQYDTMNK